MQLFAINKKDPSKSKPIRSIAEMLARTVREWEIFVKVGEHTFLIPVIFDIGVMDKYLEGLKLTYENEIKWTTPNY